MKCEIDHKKEWFFICFHFKPNKNYILSITYKHNVEYILEKKTEINSNDCLNKIHIIKIDRNKKYKHKG